MITPLLERLILNGKASFNTFVAGGGEKCILNVPNDHFVIITSIQYSSALKAKALALTIPQIQEIERRYNTQLKIFSRKSMNTFLFRDSLNIGSSYREDAPPNEVKTFVTPIGSQNIDTYLVHENDISFTFSFAGFLTDNLVAISKSETIAYPPPTDYGKAGQSGALAVRLVGDVLLSVSGQDKTAQGGQQYVVGSGAISKECIFPVDALNQYSLNNAPYSFPIVNVNYVLIQGLPNNISST